MTGFMSILSSRASKAITVIRENAELAILNVDTLRGLWELVNATLYFAVSKIRPDISTLG